jgi:hypothetical protein
VKGRALISSPETVISLAMPAGPLAPEPTLRAFGACVAVGSTTMRPLDWTGFLARRAKAGLL